MIHVFKYFKNHQQFTSGHSDGELVFVIDRDAIQKMGFRQRDPPIGNSNLANAANTVNC